MKQHAAAFVVSFLAFHSLATAQSCSTFQINARSLSVSVPGGYLYTATDYTQYPGPSTVEPFTVFDIASNGTLSVNGAQCRFSPYLVCNPGISSDEPSQFSISDQYHIEYANDSQFLICPEFAVNYQLASSLGPATTLTQSTQVTSGSQRVPSSTTTSVSLSYIMRTDGLVFVSSPGSCLSTTLEAATCADDGTEVVEATSTSNRAAQRTAVAGGILGGAALVGAFLL